MAITINGTGSITGITAGGYPDATVTADDLAATLDLSGKTVTLPAGVGGKILQVVQEVKNDQFSTTNSGRTTWTDITGLSLSITPAATTSTILLFATVQGSGIDTGWGRLCALRFVRGTQAIGLGNTRTNFEPATLSTIRASQDSNSCWHATMMFEDSPGTTNPTTYKIQGQVESSGFAINRTSNDSQNQTFSLTSISTITAMEVAA
jgi:hypothetical protein